MRKVEPKVFLIGEIAIVKDGLSSFLEHIGVPEWTTDASSDSEKIIEVMGRLCYKSFEPGLNPNVTQTRKGNRVYTEHIIQTKHGSVLEHATINFIFADVSRVFTHELVRHRAGVAISQESLRFVRIIDLDVWLPTIVKENKETMEIFVKTVEQLGNLQAQLASHFILDSPDSPFEFKKKATSAIRRIAPMGLATNIGWSTNLRTLRWVLEARTDPAAEEEIRLVFGKVGEIVMKRYPNVFQDFSTEQVDGLPWYKPRTSKI